MKKKIIKNDSATSQSDVENSYNTDNEVETDSASKSDSDNVDDTSSEVGDEYESDPWAPLKAEATQQNLSEFEELTQNFTAEGFDENEAKDKAYLLIVPKLRKDLQNIYLDETSTMDKTTKERSNTQKDYGNQGCLCQR